MSDERVLNTQVKASLPGSLVEDISLAWKSRIGRFVGAGSFGFWITFGTICLFAAALLVLARLKA